MIVLKLLLKTAVCCQLNLLILIIILHNKFYSNNKTTYMRLQQAKSAKLSLLSQIQFYKNYIDHRQRLNNNRYASPTNKLKKSLSFDNQKLGLHEYIKSRKEYTNDFHKREVQKKNGVNDAKMLGKIMQYDQKVFVISQPTISSCNGGLHHNSLVSKYKESYRIEEQNQKIHFRITKAKSLYTKTNSNKSTLLHLKGNQSIGKLTNKIKQEIRSKALTQQKYDKQQIKPRPIKLSPYSDSDRKQFHNTTANPEALVRKIAYSNRFHRTSDNFSYKGVSPWQINKKNCQRIRKQKLAVRLYERKQKMQEMMPSKIKIRK